MSRNEDEESVYRAALVGLQRWLGKARDAVMRPWFQYKMQPDPTAIFATQDAWNREVETILTVLGRISMHAWSLATDVPPVSRHAFVMSQLAQTQNFLVRMPDEIYNLIFAELTDGTNAGESLEQLARRIDNLLSWTGSENWPGRARNIAVTETTRAYGAGTLAAGMEQSRVTGKRLAKQWLTEADVSVRPSHRAVDHDIQPLSGMFMVGGFPLLFPGDPAGPADEVCGCRCDLVIVDEGGQ